MEYESVIGFEVHAQLATRTKIFCGCLNETGGPPNTRTCPVCLGMPGALPVLNEAVVDLAAAVALALNASVAEKAGFARKNYFYPDLPKGYQITQYAEPLARDGHLDVEFEGRSLRVGISQIHIEEDAGKSVHSEHGGGGSSLIDMNRCGVPLVEIVTRPDLRDVDEADAFLNELRRILVCLGVTTGKMHEGSLRFDTNVSLRPRGAAEMGARTEIKNLNSFRSVRKALTYEIGRQSRVLRDGGKVVHETLLWDESEGRAVPMRSKEGASDYRCFPEPDLVDFEIDGRRLERVKESMPELPGASRRRLVEVYGIPAYDAFVLTAEPSTLRLYESTVCALLKRLGPDAPPAAAKTVSNWVMVVLAGYLNERGTTLSELPEWTASGRPADGQDGASALPSRLADVIALRLRGEVSEPAARRLFTAAMESAQLVDELVDTLDLRAVSDEDALRSLVREVLAAHPDEVARYHAGTMKLMRFFVGQVLGRTGGKADPELATRILLEE
ncbi:MAG: Asp-tRNA(Asn)/Glu-tRNA(Gln) amidotransferase subunit GatB, partial [Candidatus Eisenbacteria bacterium]|nr:Asp-tRNA(Asn)/Glu-tRNA(Gln) amidotransferase subunit GatB [Candidatus Eisenbacteria bacterium]